MRRHPLPLAAVALLLAAFVAPLAAQAPLPAPDEGFTLPAEPAHRAAALDAELDRLAAKLERSRALLAEVGLERLDLLGEPHPESLRRDNATEFAVIDAPRDVAAWIALHDERASWGERETAIGAAWRLYELAAEGKPRAAALLRLADDYADRAEPVVARNIAALALREDASEATLAAHEALAARLRLHVTDLSVEAEQALPRACLTLSRRLAVNQPIPLADLVTVEPAADTLVSAEGDRVCIAGLAHGTSYHVTLHPGLASGDGERLETPLERDIDVPHRAASVAFAAGAYVLPRAADALLPLRSVNLSEVPLELYRVDDRNLVGTSIADLLRQPLDAWSRDRLGGTYGALAWKGVLEVDRVDDREVVTNVPLADLIGDDGPGVYALSAPLPGDYGNAATQWLVVSDIGLTTFSATDGLHVFARSLADAIPRANIELALVATNNRILATARSDTDGHARFAPGLLAGAGGDAPALLTAQAGSDYNFLSLDGAALDLSERGVAGRQPPGAADAFVYTERGIYRPGETVQLSLLLRDAQAVAMPGLPLHLRVARPGGVVVFERVLTSDALGSGHVAVPLSGAAETGTWSASVRLDPAAGPIGAVDFQVEDFVPPRIEVRATVTSARLQPGASAVLDVGARFYHGAAAADLPVDGRLRIEPDPTPFPALAAFAFGREDLEFSPLSLPLSPARTDLTGTARLDLPVPVVADRSQPLRARVTAAVHDVGGRPVYRTASAPLDLHPRYVGLRALAPGGVADGEPADFELVAVDAEGTPQPGAPLRWQWVREHHDYTWFVSGGRWSWRESVIDEPIASEDGATGADGRLAIERRLEPGRYRLDLFDAAGSASASRRFHVGWWRGAAAANVPDALDVTLAPGEGLRRTAFIDAPFAGRALVVLGNERLVRRFEVDLPEEGREIAFDVEPEWSPGLYLMVTAFRPGVGAPSPLPSRAMGLAWVSIGVAERTLAVHVEPPAETRPRQPVELPIRVDGAGDETVALTIAAVDEGVLALTDFASPDPTVHYFAQRALAADLHDLYGDLIAPLDAPLGTLRSGGGAAADNLAGVSVRSSRVVALYRRDVTVDGDGRGSVVLDLPDFNGRLRLMAVAWSARRLGAASADLLVRDPVIADLVLPRFLAPGDRAAASLDLRNPGEAPVTLTVSTTASGPVGADLPDRTLTLGPGEGRVLPVALAAGAPGVGGVAVEVALADGTRLRRDWPLTVRPATPNRIERTVQALAPGDGIDLATLPAARFHPGARRTVTVTNGIGIDVPGLLADLVDYPYGCTEQTVSRALPQLFVERGHEAFNTVTAAIARVLDRQRSDGRFGVWSASGRTPDWLTPYAYDFLWRAREHGFDVPQAALDLGERALVEMLERGDPPYAAAYAAYVLARAGEVNPALVRRFAVARGETLPTRAAHAHLGAALALVGDREEARSAFRRALVQARPDGIDDYGSDTRDAALLLALLGRHGGGGAEAAAVAEAMERMLGRGAWFSTQEQAWLLVAASEARAAAGTLSLDVDGTPREAADGTLVLADGDPADALPAVVNRGSSAARVVAQVRGAPLDPPAPFGDGYEIQRRWYDADSGEPVTPDTVARGRTLLAVIEGRSLRDAGPQDVLVVDLLPAGFEIENVVLADAAAELPPFVGLLSATEFGNARDDRFVAALRLHGPERFRLAYRVRAVTTGDFAAPGVQVEDMYAPRFRANGAAARVVVTDGG